MVWTSPISWSTIQNALRTWANGQLAWTTIWARQDAPAPAYPYVLLDRIAGPTPQHMDRKAKVEVEGSSMKVYSVGDRTFTISVEALVSFENSKWNYDQDAAAAMTLLQGSIATDAVQTAFNTAGFGVLEIGSVQDRRTALEAGWISRAGFDLTIHCVSSIEVGTFPIVETFEVSSDLDSPADLDDVEVGPAS